MRSIAHVVDARRSLRTLDPNLSVFHGHPVSFDGACGQQSCPSMYILTTLIRLSSMDAAAAQISSATKHVCRNSHGSRRPSFLLFSSLVAKSHGPWSFAAIPLDVDVPQIEAAVVGPGR